MHVEAENPFGSLDQELFASLPLAIQLYVQHLEKQIALLVVQNRDLVAQNKELAAQNKELVAQNQTLTLRVQELENRLSKNSSNSGKPPSSDGLGKQNKTKSLRGKSGKKPGGQPGRVGKGLMQAAHPDQVQVHTPQSCEKCQKDLDAVEAISIEKRQIFELPPVTIVVTEHQAETKKCPCCGHKTKGSFPEGVKSWVQYGERVHALAAYLEHQHLIPFDRLSQIFEDLYDISLSPGTCSNMDQRLFKTLEPFEIDLKAHLLACKVLHLDETGVRCQKKLHWIHVVASDTATFYGLHEKRGRKAIDAFGIVPLFQGTAVHDHWDPYFLYQQVKHALCNVHHLRELKYAHECEKVEWAERMSQLLLKAKKITNNAQEAGEKQLSQAVIHSIEEEYRTLMLEIGKSYLGITGPPDPCTPSTKTSFNLFKRLLCKMDSVLVFVRDLTVPFSNNLAEQDLRMQKVKQKISGCFRTLKGGQISCRIRSYISTARKQCWGIMDALVDSIRGAPRLLSSSTS